MKCFMYYPFGITCFSQMTFPRVAALADVENQVQTPSGLQFHRFRYFITSCNFYRGCFGHKTKNKISKREYVQQIERSQLKLWSSYRSTLNICYFHRIKKTNYIIFVIVSERALASVGESIAFGPDELKVPGLSLDLTPYIISQCSSHIQSSSSTHMPKAYRD